MNKKKVLPGQIYSTDRSLWYCVSIIEFICIDDILEDNLGYVAKLGRFIGPVNIINFGTLEEELNANSNTP